MSLTWSGIKRLIRLQAVAERLARIATQEEGTRQSSSSGTRLFAMLLDETFGVLRDADADLTGEFERFVGETGNTRLPLAARATLLAGWLDGAVEAETLEVRIRTGIGGGRPAGRSSTRHNGG